MSKYNTYARRLNEAARGRFEEYTKAKEAYDAAKKKFDDHPYRKYTIGTISAEQQASRARAEADYLTAKSALAGAEKHLRDGAAELEGIGAELRKTVNDNAQARPEQLDMATLELLKSGILRPAEYAKLLSDNAENATMARLIGSYAAQAAKAATERADHAVLARVTADSRMADGSAYLEAFDDLAAIYGKCANNPAMIPHWDELTARVIEEF